MFSESEMRNAKAYLLASGIFPDSGGRPLNSPTWLFLSESEHHGKF
jgi:hypothetical protein